MRRSIAGLISNNDTPKPRRLAWGIWLGILAPAFATAYEPPNYEDDIKPIFRTHCLNCHNADEANADIDLSTYESTLRGGSSGKVVQPGRPDSSQLYRAVAHLDGAEAMPPEGPKLSNNDISVLRSWIQSGLIAGKGKASLLKPVENMVVSAEEPIVAPMPTNLSKVTNPISGLPPYPKAVAASPGAPLIAVSGSEQVLLYKIAPEPERKLQLLGCLPVEQTQIESLRFSRNGSLLLVGGGRGGHSGYTLVFDVATGTQMGRWGDEADVALAADISANHQHIALGGPGKTVVLIDTTTNETVKRIQKHTDWITAISFSPDGKLLATGDRSGGVYVWETRNGGIAFSLDEHKVKVTQLTWRPDGKLLGSVAEDGNLILWNLDDGWPVANSMAHAAERRSRYERGTGVMDADFARNGTLVTVGRDRHLKLWDNTGQPRGRWAIAGGLPLQAKFSANGQSIVVSKFSGELQLWSIDSKKPVHQVVNGQPNTSR